MSVIYPGTSTHHVSLSHYSLPLSRDGRQQLWPKHVLIVVRYVSSLSDVCRHRNNREPANIINFQKISFPCLLICRLEYTLSSGKICFMHWLGLKCSYTHQHICILLCISGCCHRILPVRCCLHSLPHFLNSPRVSSKGPRGENLT